MALFALQAAFFGAFGADGTFENSSIFDISAFGIICLGLRKLLYFNYISNDLQDPESMERVVVLADDVGDSYSGR